VGFFRGVRLACAEGMSQREAARHFNISRDSVARMGGRSGGSSKARNDATTEQERIAAEVDIARIEERQATRALGVKLTAIV